MAKPNELKLAADIIRRVLDAAERGDIDFLDYLKMISRQGLSKTKKSASLGQSKLELKSEHADISQEYLLDQIARFSTESDLETYLRRTHSTKTEAIVVARALHVPASKTDDYEALIRRIIDATLGYKMRSLAVRGVGTTRSSSSKDEK